MKKQLKNIALIGALVASSMGMAQQDKLQPCNTYAAMEEYFAANPEAKKSYEANQDYLHNLLLQNQANMANNATAAFEYTVPVVFHILHVGGSENIADNVCINALAQVNSDFAKMGSDVNTVASPFNNLYINSDIKFMLAKKDPNGNCTNGIVHRYDVRTDWAQNNPGSNYNGITWDPTKYLNIIIVKQIIPTGTVTGGGIIVGYTYKPGTWGTGASQDAIVYNNGFLNGLDARSLTHEIGHWLNLAHTFGNTNNPGVVCGDDGLYDTPPTKGNFSSCPSSSSGNSCSSTTTVYAAGQQNTQNFMDYSSCPKNFTTNQTNAMRTALASSVSNRQNLWQNSNLVFTGINNNTPCSPIAEYYSTNNSYTVCAGGTLTFKDFSYNATVTSYNWAGDNGAIAASPNSSITAMTFPTIGTTNVTLTVGNSTGSTTKVRQVIVRDATAGIVGPFTESFESTGIPLGWSVMNQNIGSATWDQTFDAAYDGAACFMINGALSSANQVDILETPIIDVLNNSNKTFTVAIAYAQKTSTHNDQLKIEASRDCGGTWSNITVLSGSQMQSNSGGVTALSYTPVVPEEWVVWTLSGYPAWNSFINSPNVTVRFTFTEGSAGSGNNIFIDAINFFGAGNGTGLTQLTKNLNLSVYPNPSNGEATLNFNLNESASVKVNVVDVLGKQMLPEVSANYGSGENTLVLNKNNQLAKGIYLVNISINGTTVTKKLVIN